MSLNNQDISCGFDMDDDDDDALLASCSMDVTNTLKRRKPINVTSSAKKETTWIASSFGDFMAFDQPKISKSKQSRGTSSSQSVSSTKHTENDSDVNRPSVLPTSHAPSATNAVKKNKRKKNNTNELWSDQHRPQCQAELAVHKKKITELQDFLEHSLNRKLKKAPILLLTGPSGAGKTATVQVLADEMAIEIQEWINPTTEAYSSTWQPGGGDFVPVGGRTYESQTSLFQDFILRANRYPSLQIFNQDQLHRKLILVEDFPNVFFRNTSQFHDILRNYHQRGQCPLVFIVSDSAGGDSNERLLFPKDIQAELAMANISFNPVAPTILTKVLTRIASAEANQSGSRMKIPSKSTIDGLSSASSGDVRGAINALQFASLKDTHDLDDLLSNQSQPALKKSSSRSGKTSSKPSARSKKTAKSKKQSTDGDLAAIGGRDTSLFLFRALGKILYCKRCDPDSSEVTRLPDHLHHCYRDPLSVNPEDVIERSQLSGDFFTSYLHQNYLDFYTQLDDTVASSEYFSDADHLTTDWANRTVLRDYAASVASRGLMFCNSGRATSSGKGPSGLGWKPLHKPHMYEVNRKLRSNKETARCLFRRECCTPEELHMTVLPYLSLINVPLKGVGQISFLQEMCKFEGKNIKRWNSNRLDEKDVTKEDSDEESATSTAYRPHISEDSRDGFTASQDQGKPPVYDDDDVLIEDFDD